MEELRLTLRDAADLCGVPVKQMEQARRRGSFPHATSSDGGPWRVSVSELRAAGFVLDANRLARWRRLAQDQGVWGTEGLGADDG
jgi:hypothetical protein